MQKIPIFLQSSRGGGGFYSFRYKTNIKIPPPNILIKLTKIYPNAKVSGKIHAHQARIKPMTYKRGKRSIRVYRPSAYS